MCAGREGGGKDGGGREREKDENGNKTKIFASKKHKETKFAFLFKDHQ